MSKVFLSMSKNDSLKQQAVELRAYYISIFTSSLISILCILIWIFNGMGYFWPFWVILGLGSKIIIRALNLKKLPWLIDMFPFLSKDWEEQQYETLKRQEDSLNVKESPELSLDKVKVEKPPLEKKKRVTKSKKTPS